MQRNRSSSSGFTVIEIMIVLVIAGLIVLIVFLAVPSMQRNARKNSQQSDIGRLLAGINEYRVFNNGSIPPAPQINFGSGSKALIGGPGGVCQAGIQCVAVNLSYYDAGSISLFTTPPASSLGSNYATLLSGYRCSGNAATPGSTQQIAIVYELEDGTPGCKAT